MLVIDENLLRLSKMQEALLKVSNNSNRKENLDKYIKTITEIDKLTFSFLMEKIQQNTEHNRTLENELTFLEQVKSYYEQVNEMQMGFKNVCELYGDSKLKLSDISQINIEYIENRISIISGYLINKKNIDDNKKRLQELNDDLIKEEKNSRILSQRLIEFEKKLRDNFINAEGRIINGGKLDYISIVSEYKKLEYDLVSLLDDKLLIDNSLSILNNELQEMVEKLRVAEICYNRNPNSLSRSVFDEVNKEYLGIKYKLTLVKILKLMSEEYDNYNLFKDKREKLLDLIKYRKEYLSQLNVHFSIDPFDRIKVSDQLEVISSLSDNFKVVGKLKKLIAELTERIDEMVYQNDEYKMEINNTEDLIISKIRITDIDISSVELDDISISNDDLEKVILVNQVASVKDVPISFDIGIARQKTNGVIRKVNEMINRAKPMVSKTIVDEVISPDLVIVREDNKIEEDIDKIEVLDEIIEENIFEVPIEEVEIKDNEIKEDIQVSSIFETAVPFLDTPLFVDRTDEVESVVVQEEPKKIVQNIFEEENVLNVFEDISSENVSNLKVDDIEEMPDAFWVTQDDDNNEEKNGDVILSFDEQIDALLKDNENNKVKKLVA